MHLAVVAPNAAPAVDRSTMAYAEVSKPQFLFLANYLLDAGHNVEQVTHELQMKFHDQWNRSLYRPVKGSDVLLARQILTERVPTPILRYEMAVWALTLSREFRRMAGFITKNAPQFTEAEADLLTERFQGFLSKRAFASGYGCKKRINRDEIISSFMLYPEDTKGEVPNRFATPEAAIFEWCRTVPFKTNDTALTAYAKYVGDAELIDRLQQACQAACAPPLPKFMSDEQKAFHAKMGDDCFWTMAEYINWLSHSNPMDVK